MNNTTHAFFYFQIEKIMSSIGEGIDFSQEQHRISGSVPSMCLSVLAVLCTQTRCWLLCVDVFNLLWLWEGERNALAQEEQTWVPT